MLSREFSVLLSSSLGRLAHDEGAQPLERLGDQVRHLGGQHGEEAVEVLGVPGAGEVGLAEADQLVAAEPQEELVRAAHDHRPDRPGRAVFVTDVDGDVEPVDGRLEQGPGDPRSDAGPGAVGTTSRPGQWFAERRAEVMVMAGPPSARGVGRGCIGSRRSHSQMPCIRIRAVPRMAAGAVCLGERSARRPGQRGAERCTVVGPEGDRDVEPAVVGDRDRELVGAVGAVERRDVHRLGSGGPALLVGVDEVGVPVAVGVVHLDDGGRRSAGAVPAPEDARSG